MFKHTPGKWKVVKGNFIVTEKDEQIVAEVPCQGCNDNDLPLIASAPELLEACKLALGYCWKSTSYNPEKELEQAIKKAEGR